MIIWIDIKSGTYGEYNDDLVLVEVSEEELKKFDGMSDSEISAFGRGSQKRPLTPDELIAKGRLEGWIDSEV